MMRRGLLLVLVLVFLSPAQTFAASRFWVGGAGNWNGSDTTHWSATSGGSSGASVPTSSDDVTFDNNSGLSGATVTLNGSSGSAVSKNFTASTGASWTLDAVSSNISVYGSWTLESGLTTANNLTWTLRATSTGHTMDQNAATLDAGITLNGAGGGWTLIGDVAPLTALSLVAGTFDASTYNVSASSVTVTGTGTRVLNMGSGTWTITGTGTGFTVSGSNKTINAQTSTIKFVSTDNNDVGISGDSHTYYNIWWDRGASTGDSRITTGSNTFNSIRDTGTGTHKFYIRAGTTQTFATWDVSGTPGHLISLDSFTGAVPSTSTHTLIKTGGGQVSSDYLSIQHSIASPSCTFFAGTNSTNNQAVATAGSGWTFTAPVTCATSFGILTFFGWF